MEKGAISRRETQEAIRRAEEDAAAGAARHPSSRVPARGR